MNRQALWHKLNLLGCSSKFLSLFRNMYGDVKSCVKLVDGNCSEVFSSFTGVRQGDNLSPILFSLFIYDMASDLSVSQKFGVLVLHIRLLLLMFADDMVLISHTITGLQ